MAATTKELAVIRPENISEIAAGAATAYGENETSLRRCSACGEDLLRRIGEGGMTPELDAEAASFIERARKTLRKMNEKRTGITRLFDGVKTAFTTLENAVDPARKDTVAWMVQQERNAYAAARREEEQRRQREEAERQRRERARTAMRTELETSCNIFFTQSLNDAIRLMEEPFNSTTLENYEQTYRDIYYRSADLPDDFEGKLTDNLSRYQSSFQAGSGLTASDWSAAAAEAVKRLMPEFVKSYREGVERERTELLDRFPSKKAQLEKAAEAAKVDEAGAERIRRQMEEADRAAAERRERERQEKEERDRAEAALAAKQTETANLFSQAAAQQEAYVPRTKVTKRIELLNPEGILPVISFWFVREGCRLSTEELAKMFKRQITYAEKIANCPNPELIRDESVAYVDEVKAR